MMKKSMVLPIYLFIGIVLFIYAIGNQGITANRIAGMRRVWDIKATWGGANIPINVDNISTNTGKTVTMSKTVRGPKPNSGISTLFIEKYNELKTYSLYCVITRVQKKPVGNSSTLPLVYFVSIFTPSDNKMVACNEAIPFSYGSGLKIIVLKIKKILNYLERLPGH